MCLIFSFFFFIVFFIFFFFFNDTATTEIYTLSLHDALPILESEAEDDRQDDEEQDEKDFHFIERSEEHTSELQSLTNLVCRLLLEKKKKEFSAKDFTRNTQVSPDSC